jgi:signal transduction histidine kinase
MNPTVARRFRKVFWMFALWTLIGLSFAAQFYFSSLALEKPVSWGRAWRAALADWYLLAALFLPTFWLAKRFPLERPLRYSHLGVHVVASAVFAVTHLAVYILSRAVVFPADHFAFAESFQFWFLRRFHGNLLYYWTFSAAAHALNYYRHMKDREVRAAELEARLAQSQLGILKAQLQPHFLFNTLNAISELIHENPAAAEQLLTRLGDLLRLSLKTATEQWVSLKQEVEFVESYLEIHRARLGDRLRITFCIDPATLDTPVPNLVLQPLVENAIRHGIGASAGVGLVEVTARHEGEQLILTVRDNGPGLSGGHLNPAKPGVGISNLRRRLHCLYGSSCDFHLGTHPEGGCAARICLPAVPPELANPKSPSEKLA